MVGPLAQWFTLGAMLPLPHPQPWRNLAKDLERAPPGIQWVEGSNATKRPIMHSTESQQ